ncbi:hypothetical protein EVAR_64944_1 [Eumeta japonica]|uniref:Uncharacterized protein n=1 Tax=Eumeta variegata TaxID=151549 RepID=A0A4C1ZFF3_EUMVA|nr:hypothetical protein EVAR_64944_1 [Eumeta japonica]
MLTNRMFLANGLPRKDQVMEAAPPLDASGTWSRGENDLYGFRLALLTCYKALMFTEKTITYWSYGQCGGKRDRRRVKPQPHRALHKQRRCRQSRKRCSS